MRGGGEGDREARTREMAPLKAIRVSHRHITTYVVVRHDKIRGTTSVNQPACVKGQKVVFLQVQPHRAQRFDFRRYSPCDHRIMLSETRMLVKGQTKNLIEQYCHRSHTAQRDYLKSSTKKGAAR